MNKKNRTIVSLIRNVLILSMLGLLLSFYGCKRSSQNNEDSIKQDVGAKQEEPVLNVKQEKPENIAAPAAGLTSIQIEFMLDPRLTRGQYMGDRWVSPSTYTRVGEGKEITVEARAYGLGAGKKLSIISPKWIPQDPEMVTVSPNQGNMVKIIVKHAGKSGLKVVFGGISRELLIKASPYMDTMQVEITQ